MGGRDQSEQVVAINRNQWSESARARIGGRGPKVAEAVMTIGFPLKGLLSSDPIVTTGIISALSGIKGEEIDPNDCSCSTRE
jgi:S1-C subfamily serine protease